MDRDAELAKVFAKARAIVHDHTPGNPNAIRMLKDIAQEHPLLFRRLAGTSDMNLLQSGILEKATVGKLSVMLSADPGLARIKWRSAYPLELAINHRLDSCFLEELMAAWPASVRLRDSESRFAFNAILAGATSWHGTAALKALRLFPEVARLKEGSYPLHLAIERRCSGVLVAALLRTFRLAASLPMDDGRMPLHVALQTHLPWEMQAKLIEACPRALLMPMAGRMLPLEYAITQGLAREVVLLLADGCPSWVSDDCTPMAAVCARAAATGLRTRLLPRRRVVDDRGQPFEWQSKQPLVTGGVRFIVTPEMSPPIVLEARLTDPLHLVTRRIEQVDGTAERDQILLLNGERLQPELSIGDNGIRENVAVAMRRRDRLLPLALRRSAHEPLVRNLIKWRPRRAREVDLHGNYPLHLAIDVGASDAVLKDLIEVFAAATLTPFAHTGTVFPLQRLLEKHYSLDVIEALLRCGHREHWDTQTGAYHPVKLPDHLIPPFPLAVAIEANCDTSIIKVLLGARALPEARNQFTGYNHVELVLTKGRHHLFHTLLSSLMARRPLALTEAGPKGMHLLHVALLHQAPSSITLDVIELAPASVDAVDADGRLPIHIAMVARAPSDVVHALLRASPGTVRATDGRGRTPLQLAVVSEVPRGVLSEACIVDPSSFRGRELLDLAVRTDAPDWVIQELVALMPDTSFFSRSLWRTSFNRAACVAVQELKNREEARASCGIGPTDVLDEGSTKASSGKPAVHGCAGSTPFCEIVRLCLETLTYQKF
uniref:Ubiquitin-like domain-containing protein n=1 Tax=Noctiluca scintillans TaxID=2966 RepID=A0A7S1F944_NOCSC|mmetsp:Transcript_4155/g.11721  ORF Transcript_4155/g.11721 Transcript_4155/m.11721 type:complete len:774 (+) Transcript_4155:42-2363(+)